MRAWTLNAPRQSSSSSGHLPTSTSGSSARAKRTMAASLSWPGGRGGKKSVHQVGNSFLTTCIQPRCSLCTYDNCHILLLSIIIIIIISLCRHFMGPPARRAASQSPLLPPSAGPPQDVHSLQALASLRVSLHSRHCTSEFSEVKSFHQAVCSTHWNSETTI